MAEDNAETCVEHIEVCVRTSLKDDPRRKTGEHRL